MCNCHIAEMLVFIRLNEQRLVGNREFFDINIELAIACIDNVVDFVNADTSGSQEQIRANQEQYKQMRNRNIANLINVKSEGKNIMI